MGNRISFSFRNTENGMREESVVFFAHWSGKDLLDVVSEYVNQLMKTLEKRKEEELIGSHPIDRLEPRVVMVDFIRWFFPKLKGSSPYHDYSELVQGSYYLGATTSDGDNSDNGHWVYDLNKQVWEQTEQGW